MKIILHSCSYGVVDGAGDNDSDYIVIMRIMIMMLITVLKSF